MSIVLNGCGVSPTASEPASSSPTNAATIGSCSLEGAPFRGDEEAITALLQAEGRLVVAQDIEALMRLWAVDGAVTDVKHTPANATDDQTWQGEDAIRYRYVRVVFPSAPLVAHPAALKINIAETQANVIATTQIGEEISKGGDHWQVIQKDGCWIIQELRFNVEAE